MVFLKNRSRTNEGRQPMITTSVVRDYNGDEYLVTVFDNGATRLAIRENGERTWGAPLPLTRTERTETE